MIAQADRIVRVLLPNDLRLIWRDGFLLLLILMSPLYCLLLRWLLPYAAGLTAEWIDLERYYSLILAGFVVAQQPILLGVVVGILFVEEREEGTLLALQTSPLSLRRFLGYRLLLAMGLSVVLTLIGLPLAGLVAVSFLESLTAAFLASFTVPLVALIYSVAIQNKVQAVASIKLAQSWALLPVLLYFAPTPWQWIGSLLAPLYYSMRLFWSAAAGEPEWWLIGPGLIVQGAGILWLLRRFQRVLYA